MLLDSSGPLLFSRIICKSGPKDSVDPAKGKVAIQILLLGAIFVVMGICSDGMYALMAGTLGQWLGGSARFIRAQRYFAGSVYIALGVTTAFSGSNRK